MSRTVELVLEIEAQAANEWMSERAAHARRGQPHAGTPSIGHELADRLSRTRSVELLHARELVSVRAFQIDDAARRVLLEERSGVRRLLATRAKRLVPGVMLSEAVCDVALEAGTPLAFNDALPSEVAHALGMPDALVPSSVLVMNRTVWRWQASDSPAVDITLLDAYDLAAPENAATHARALPRFCELHLSASCNPDTHSHKGHDEAAPVVAAAARAVFAVAERLVDILPAFPALTDAFARARGEAPPSGPVRAARVELFDAKTPHEALLAIGCNVAWHWFGNEHGVRESTTTEFVHQMRVALRRMKTLLKTFPRWIDDTWMTRVAPGIDWLGELLGEARDLDVFVDATLPTLAAADIDAKTWQKAHAAAQTRRLQARASVQQALRSRRHAALSLAWLDWLAGQHFASGPQPEADSPLTEYAAKRVRKHYQRLTAEPALTALDAAARHRRRIEAKRLRYTLEFFEGLASPKTRRLVAKQLSRLQSVLGDGSDAATALRFLEELEVPSYQKGFARGWCEAVNRCAAHEGERLLSELRKPKIVRDT